MIWIVGEREIPIPSNWQNRNYKMNRTNTSPKPATERLIYWRALVRGGCYSGSRVAYHYTHPHIGARSYLLAPFAHNQSGVDPVTKDDGFGPGSLLRRCRGSDPLKVQSTIIMTEVDVPSKFEEVNKKL